MITDRDRQIVRHFEQYKYATIEQIEKIFFRRQKNGYNIARRRLGAIKQAGYIKVDRDIESNRLVFMLNDPKVKLPDRHRLLVLDVLANLHYNDFDVQQFEVEKRWQDGSIRSDAFTVFALNNGSIKNRYHYFIEVHLSENGYRMDKYDALYESGEVQEYLGRNVCPRILLVTDYGHKPFTLKYPKVVTVNSRLDAFASVILPS